MFNSGVVVSDSGRGFWWIETPTRDCIFVHQNNVVGKKFLHVNDRVKFNLAPNPKKPGEMMAVEVQIVGLTIARQVSALVSPPEVRR